jgi:hypothetical protein
MRRDPRTISQIERCDTPVRMPGCARGHEMSGLDSELVVVQFPHPGREHDPGDATVMPWNTKDHGRKFLRSTGRYLDAHGALGSGTVMFWGEWEAQSRVVDRYPDASTGMPRFVHEPFVQRPGDMGAERQNTDPFVFGETFLYSNCRQFTPDEQPSRLQRLSPGSIILFGSPLERRFVLDTVLVVGSATRYVIGEPGSFDDGVPAAFRAATLEPLAAARKLIGVSAHLYQGVMHGPEQQEMFSFVPVAVGNQPFARPAIELPGLVNPASWRSARLTIVTAQQVRDVWHDVVASVLAQGLSIGVFLAEPDVVPGRPVVVRSDRGGCAVGQSPGDRQICGR